MCGDMVISEFPTVFLYVRSQCAVCFFFGSIPKKMVRRICRFASDWSMILTRRYIGLCLYFRLLRILL